MRIRVLVFKEWEEVFRIRLVIFSVLFMPLLLAGFATYLVWQAQALPEEAAGARAALFNTALMYFLILPVIIPVTIAVYSIVGEKEQGTLEPLLATPLTDWELFLGKALAAVLPALGLTWGVFGLFLGAAAVIMKDVPREALAPTWLVSIFLLSPLLALFGVLVTMIVSSRTSDPRAAYQFSGLALIPALVPLIVYSARQTAVSMLLVGLEGALVLALDVAILYLAVRLFRREEILTHWK